MFLSAGVIALLVFADLRMRARQFHARADVYRAWYEKPELKKIFAAEALLRESAGLETRFKGGGFSAEAYARDKRIAEARQGVFIAESAAKQAYYWYKDVNDFFGSPPSSWAGLARDGASRAREQWLNDLKARGIPFGKYQLSAGEE